MRVLVCGGRDYKNRETVYRVLNGLEPSLIITGYCRGDERSSLRIMGGADELAEDWAKKEGVPLLLMPALWGAHGKSAGPKRNGWMIQFARPHLVVAFPGGRGTANMVRQAQAAGVRVQQGETA